MIVLNFTVTLSVYIRNFVTLYFFFILVDLQGSVKYIVDPTPAVIVTIKGPSMRCPLTLSVFVIIIIFLNLYFTYRFTRIKEIYRKSFACYHGTK